MDPTPLIAAFALGLAARLIGLPPLVGFLVAGFILNAFGFQADEGLKELADFGVVLLLFSIGLKLRVRGLFRPEIWAAASIHLILTIAASGAIAFALAVGGFMNFAGLTLGQAALLAFALSFSSTVFAVKVLAEKGESASLYGRTAVGILIMQDLFAVLFLALAAGTHPTWWALLVPPVLLVARPILTRILDHAGHGELLVLAGVLLVLGASGGFEAVGLKAGLGALIVGALISDHRKSGELAKTLMGFKDLFLVGFFLTIGLAGTPTLSNFGVAILLLVIIPLKGALFVALLMGFKLRASTSLRAGLVLSNYSEFGLIVTSVGVAQGWLDSEWLVIMGIAVSLTFVIGSPLNVWTQGIAARFVPKLARHERSDHHPEERPVDLAGATIAICGMGGAGTGAYDELHPHYGDRVVGFEADPDKVARHLAEGRHVVNGDATDAEFVARLTNVNLEVMALTLPNPTANIAAARLARAGGFTGTIVALARFADEAEALEEAGVDQAFDSRREAGEGLAVAAIEALATPDDN